MRPEASPVAGSGRQRRTQAPRLHVAIAIVGAVTTVAALLAGCSSASSTSTKHSDTLTIAALYTPQTLSPLLTGVSLPFQWYVELAYEPLIRFGPDNKLRPGLAQSWEYVGSGNRVFDVHLRPNARFSDGSPVTASAVVRWLRVALKQFSARRAFANIKSVEAIDPTTVEIKSSGNPILPQLLSDDDSTFGYVVGPEGLRDLDQLKSTTDGAGPYMLDTAKTIANSTYVYVPNPHYYDKSKIHWHKVVVKVITDPNATLAALKSGAVQVAQGDSTNAAAAEAAGLTVTHAPYALACLQLTDPDGKVVPALAKPKVRQALAYALDRKAIMNAIFGRYGNTDQANGVAGDQGITESLENHYTHDIAKAKSLLAEAGYPDGFTVTVIATTTQLGMKELAETVKAQWAEINVKVKILAPPPAVWVTDVTEKHKGDMMTISWLYSDLYLFAQSNFGSNSFSNYYQYRYAPIDKALSDAASAPYGSPQYNAALETIASTLIEQGYEIPVGGVDAIVMHSPSIGGIAIPGGWGTPNPLDWYPAK